LGHCSADTSAKEKTISSSVVIDGSRRGKPGGRGLLTQGTKENRFRLQEARSGGEGIQIKRKTAPPCSRSDRMSRRPTQKRRLDTN